MSAGTGVRINHIAPGQIDVGVDLKNFDMRGMTTQLPPASLQSKEVKFELPPASRFCKDQSPLAMLLRLTQSPHNSPSTQTLASNAPVFPRKLPV